MLEDAQVIEDWINRVNEEGVNLTKWELSFMESVTEQFEKWRTISDKQEEILERIYAQRTK